ncbi:heterokaryon incompatibility protein-domain-containing protein [Xylaria cf. heliscus]|nr:heterokaryon incompatibility protein-domain-containing protein [Xylaria cf. heliscus]
MRCVTCAALRSTDLILGGLVQMHDNVKALKASAEAGCDFCTLCWTGCGQKHDKIQLENLLRGLDSSGDEVDDGKVYLRGLIYPSRPHKFLGQHDESSPPNMVLVSLGTAFTSLVDLHIFADPGTPAASIFVESWTTIDRNPRFHVDFARYWMNECRTRHKLCSSSSSFFGNGPNAEMPTRLIDIGSPSQTQDQDGDNGKPVVRLVITRTPETQIQAPYVALSYCWGKSTTQSPTCLRPSNYQALLDAGIAEPSLPKTHRDTFALARDLGFRYVWIDALCIVQGDADDWARESGRMAQVYGHASLTVIAGRAADCADGFLENRLRPAVDPCLVPFYPDDEEREGARPSWFMRAEATAGSFWAALPRSPLDGPVSRRGWCFQESVLSTRALVFAAEQLHFQCLELRISEDGSVRRAKPFRMLNGADSRYSRFSSEADAHAGSSSSSGGPMKSGPGQGPGGELRDDVEEVRRWLIFWYDTVFEFSDRDLTNAADVFAALAGLAQIVKPRVRSRYLCGLWEADLVRGLLWRPWNAVVARTRTICERRTTAARVPSWSWATVQGQVTVDAVNRKEADYHASNWLVRPKYPGSRWTRDSDCRAAEVRIRGCRLEFFGRLRRVRCRPYPHKTQLDLSDNHPGTLKAARRRAAMVLLVPYENEAKDEAKAKTDPVPAPAPTTVTVPGDTSNNRVVAQATFDIPEERIDSCWCVPLTKKAGLLLVRDEDEDGAFRRAGTFMDVRDLEWMLDVREEEVWLV